jgi:hypothetical protein
VLVVRRSRSIDGVDGINQMYLFDERLYYRQDSAEVNEGQGEN